MKLEKGLIQVYTGNGKGKTTAALGQILRSLGHGLKCYLFLFLKSDPEIMGEIKSLERFSDLIKVECFDTKYEIFKIKEKEEIERLKSSCKRMLNKIWKAFEEEVDILVLDEINCALDLGLVEEEEIIKLIERRPEKMELILTGRNASPEITKRADLVTEMLMIKHPYPEKIKARRGIEY
jgi:cob(I)alamin adenosyltransferase